MSDVRGHFDGSVVVLDEPVPEQDHGPVLVRFPGSNDHRKQDAPSRKRRTEWPQERVPGDNYEGSVADEVIRQRRMDE